MKAEKILNLLMDMVNTPKVLEAMVCVLFVCTLIIFIAALVSLKKQKKIVKRLEGFMGPMASELNLEKLLVDFVKNSRDVAAIQENINNILDTLDDRINEGVNKAAASFNNKTNEIESRLELLNESIETINNILTYTIQKIGIVRYNPFPDVGGDLSFSIAMLDKTNSGFVMTGIYSRNGSFTYLKPVRKGRGDENDKRYRLSAEETEAVQRAMVAH